MDHQEFLVKMGHQALAPVQTDHQDQTLSSTTAFYLFLLSVHAKPPVALQDHQDHQAPMDSQEPLDRVEMTVRPDLKVRQVLLVLQVNRDNQDNVVHQVNLGNLFRENGPLQDLQDNLEDLALQANLGDLVLQARMATMVHQETQENLANAVLLDQMVRLEHQESLDNLAHQAAATIALLLVLLQDTKKLHSTIQWFLFSLPTFPLH